MKAIITMIVAVAASSAFGMTVERYEENLGGISLDNACITATQVKSKKDQKVCASALVPHTYQDGENTFTDWVCPSYKLSSLAIDRAQQVATCVEYSYQDDNMICKTMGTKSVVVGPKIKVQVETGFPGEQLSVSYKEVTLPACQ
jgi:hypothetical protein